MTEIPKIVHQRLRAAVGGDGSDGAHPDANALNAFAEQALSLTERENVVAHLALCGTCREVVLTALPEIVVPEVLVVAEPQAILAPVAVTKQRRALLWPSLRWGMLAAGVVTAILLAHPGFEHLTNSARNRAASTVQQPATAEIRPQSTVGKSVVGSSGTEAKSDTLASNEATKAQANAGSNPRLNSAAASRNHGMNTRKRVSEPAALVAENRVTSADHPFSSGSEAAAIVRAKPALGASAQAQKTLSPGESTLDETAGPSSGVLKESPRWEVEAGSLKRSLDGGLSWETVLQPASSLLCYASRGAQMWAGGQGGTLLHSGDGGANWSTITVSVGGKILNSDIKDISLEDPAVVVLTTTDGKQLASKDSGRSWEQK